MTTTGLAVLRAAVVMTVLLVTCPGLVDAQDAARPADPAAAEREYRVARRLAVERSSQARAGLERVVELDPSGARADDALLDLALLEQPARWPEQIGSLETAAVRRARAALQQIVERLPHADRAPEARLWLAMLMLEPVPGRDAAASRELLLAVSSDRRSESLAPRARLVLGWSYEITGDLQRALGAYRRLVLDSADPEVLVRARAGCGRVLLRAADHAAAAVELDRALRVADEPDPAIRALRELAMRRVQRRAGLEPKAPPVLRAAVDVRSPIGFAARPGGGVLLADRREGEVVLYRPDGTPERRYLLARADAVGSDPSGRIVATAGDTLYRLLDELWRPLAPLGELEQASVVTAAADGRVWLVGRRGQRLATVVPGSDAVEIVWSSRDAKLTALAVDGAGVLALDERGRRVVRFDADGGAAAVISGGAERPTSLAADASGRIAVLDDRTRSVLVYDAEGTLLETRQPRPEVFRRPTAVTIGADGALHLLDPAAGSWGRWP